MWLLSVVLILLFAGGGALAGDAKKPSLCERLAQLKEHVKQHRAERSAGALKADIVSIKKLYKAAAADDKLRGEIIETLGALPKGTRKDELYISVLYALCELRDMRGAKFIRPLLKQPNKKKASAVLDVAVAAAGDLPDASLVNPLLAIVLNSKHYGILHDAVISLGKFGRCKSKRVKILLTVVGTAQKENPGAPPRIRRPKDDYDPDGSGSGSTTGAWSGPGARWKVLSRCVPKAMSELTNVQQDDLEDWFMLVKRNKRRLHTFFRENEKS